MFPEPPLLQTEQHQLPHPLLTRLTISHLPPALFALLWTCTRASILSSEELQTEHSTPGVYRDTVTTLLLLATLFLMQGRTPLASCLHCWLTFSQAMTNTPKSFSSAVFQPLCPKPAVLHGVVVEAQDTALSQG